MFQKVLESEQMEEERMMTMTKVKTNNLRIAMLAMGIAMGVCGGNMIKASTSDVQHAAPAAIEHAAPMAYTQTSDAGNSEIYHSDVLAMVEDL